MPKDDMKLLHVYPQEFEHCEAFIVGNRLGLNALRAAIERALDYHEAHGAEVYASDGEGYYVLVVPDESPWGEGPGSWSHEPFYTRQLLTRPPAPKSPLIEAWYEREREAQELEWKGKQLQAPWTKEQVASLNAYQEAGKMHPYTCKNEHHRAKPLVATKDGWVCPEPGCGYKQDWCWRSSADWSWNAK